MGVTLSPDYEPSEDEDFMNPQQLEFFRQMLLNWKNELVREAGETLNNLTEGNLQQPDLADRDRRHRASSRRAAGPRYCWDERLPSYRRHAW